MVPLLLGEDVHGFWKLGILLNDVQKYKHDVKVISQACIWSSNFIVSYLWYKKKHYYQQYIYIYLIKPNMGIFSKSSTIDILQA